MNSLEGLVKIGGDKEEEEQQPPVSKRKTKKKKSKPKEAKSADDVVVFVSQMPISQDEAHAQNRGRGRGGRGGRSRGNISRARGGGRGGNQGGNQGGNFRENNQSRRGQSSFRGDTNRGRNNFRGSINQHRGDYYNRGAPFNGYFRHPNAPPPISFQRRIEQGPLPSFEFVEKAQQGEVFDFMGLMEEQLRMRSPGYVYNQNFPPLRLGENEDDEKLKHLEQGVERLLIEPLEKPNTEQAEKPFESAPVSPHRQPNSRAEHVNKFGHSDSNLLPFYEHSFQGQQQQQQVGYVGSSGYAAPSSNSPFAMPVQYVENSPMFYSALQYVPFEHASLATAVDEGPAVFDHRDEIVRHIEYYFSPQNLRKDLLIRCSMDQKGFVPLTVILSFPKVQALTNDIKLIGRILQNSSVVEMDAEGLKVRARNNWDLWLPRAAEKERPQPEEIVENREQMKAFIIEAGDSEEEQ